MIKKTITFAKGFNDILVRRCLSSNTERQQKFGFKTMENKDLKKYILPSRKCSVRCKPDEIDNVWIKRRLAFIQKRAGLLK